MSGFHRNELFAVVRKQSIPDWPARKPPPEQFTPPKEILSQVPALGTPERFHHDTRVQQFAWYWSLPEAERDAIERAIPQPAGG